MTLQVEAVGICAGDAKTFTGAERFWGRSSFDLLNFVSSILNSFNDPSTFQPNGFVTQATELMFPNMWNPLSFLAMSFLDGYDYICSQKLASFHFPIGVWKC